MALPERALLNQPLESNLLEGLCQEKHMVIDYKEQHNLFNRLLGNGMHHVQEGLHLQDDQYPVKDFDNS